MQRFPSKSYDTFPDVSLFIITSNVKGAFTNKYSQTEVQEENRFPFSMIKIPRLLLTTVVIMHWLQKELQRRNWEHFWMQKFLCVYKYLDR